VGFERHKPSAWLVFLFAIVALSAVSWLVARSGVSLLAYLLASSIVLFDGLDIAARLWLRHHEGRRHDSASVPAGRPRPWAILLSIHNMEREIDALLENLSPYRMQVWIVDDASTDATALRLRAAGWRFIPLGKNRKKPGAIAELLRHLPPEIDTVLVMDPDISLPGNLVERIYVFQQSNAAAMCPKVTVRPDGSLAEFQHIEYTLAFDLGRHSLSPQTVTSGVAVYDRGVLENALKRHSFSVYGEDLENAIAILGAGADIIYDPELVLETQGKCDISGWFSQRAGWAFSLFKLYTEQWRDIRRIMSRSPLCFYQFGVYLGVFGIILWPFKLLSIVILAYSGLNGLDELFAANLIPDNALNHPAFFAACYVKYTVVTLAAFLAVAPRRDLVRGMAFLPFYFLYCVALILPTLIGYVNWISLRLFGRRVYADHYDESPVLGRGPRYV
jgi:cellulose synthase/poly-beta-1,6-N-acetylglucosamine synthase-like glycosyltransferase